MRHKILHLIGSFHEGGSERQAIQLARLSRETGHFEVKLACLDANGVLRVEADEINFGEIPEFPLTSFYDRNALRQARRFARFLREREISLVHTHDFYTNVFGIPAAAFARVPVRIASRRETTGWRTGAQKFIERRVYGLSDSVIANADVVRTQLISEGVSGERIVTIYNGLDLERVRLPAEFNPDAALRELGLPEADHQLVTIIANLRHQVKNHAMFLRAARTISQKVPSARFVIAGEGDLMRGLRSMAADLGLSEKVFFIGRCKSIGELLSVSNVCVLSSTAEGFSNSILEYMAAARPVVSTDVGGAREAVVDGQTGYLVRSDDDDAMAHRVTYLLSQPALAREMGKRGRQIVEQKFSCKRQLERTQQLYDRLLSQSPSSHRQAQKNRSRVSIGAEP
jgi:L-malate glycosyltransferase